MLFSYSTLSKFSLNKKLSLYKMLRLGNSVFEKKINTTKLKERTLLVIACICA